MVHVCAKLTDSVDVLLIVAVGSVFEIERVGVGVGLGDAVGVGELVAVGFVPDAEKLVSLDAEGERIDRETLRDSVVSLVLVDDGEGVAVACCVLEVLWDSSVDE